MDKELQIDWQKRVAPLIILLMLSSVEIVRAEASENEQLSSSNPLITSSSKRSGDLVELRKEFLEEMKNLKELQDKYKIVTSWQGDVMDPSGWGGPPTSKMHFFLSEDERVFRLHPGNKRKSREIVELPKSSPHLPYIKRLEDFSVGGE